MSYQILCVKTSVLLFASFSLFKVSVYNWIKIIAAANRLVWCYISSALARKPVSKRFLGLLYNAQIQHQKNVSFLLWLRFRNWLKKNTRQGMKEKLLLTKKNAHTLFYKKVFYKKMSLKNLETLRKCEKNRQPRMPELQFLKMLFFPELFKSCKIE